MLKIIRFSGLIGFLVLFAILAVIWYFISGFFAKWALEESAQRLSGLPITVDRASLKLNPIGFDFHGLQIPDRSDVNKNALYIQTLSADLDFWKALRGKITVSDLQSNGMEFDHQRQTPWVPLPTPKPGEKTVTENVIESGKNYVEDKTSKIPSPEEILEKEKQQLITRQKLKALSSQFDESQQAINQSLKDLPSKESIDQYKQEIDSLTQSKVNDLEDFQQKKTQLENLKKNIQKDRESITRSLNLIKNSKRNIQNAIAELRAAPKQDLKRLSEKYNLKTALNLKSMAQYLLGSELYGYYQQALDWYEWLQPYIPEEDSDENTEVKPTEKRLVGRDIHFPTNNPDPEFWLQKAFLSAKKSEHEFDIRLKDFTNEPNILNRPGILKMNLSEEQSSRDKTMMLDGTITPEKQDFALNWTGLSFDNQALVNSDEAQINLNAGDVSIQGRAQIVDGQADLLVNSFYKQTEFLAEGQGTFNQQLAAALKHIQNFDLTVKAKGHYKDLDLKLSSNLDKKIGNALTQQLKSQQNKVTARLEHLLQKEVQDQLASFDKQLEKLGIQQDQLLQSGSILDQLKGQQLTDYKEQQKKAAEDAEDAVKNKAEEEKKKQEEKLKDSLKDVLPF